MSRRVWVVQYMRRRGRVWMPWQMDTSRRSAEQCAASMRASRPYSHLEWRVVEYVPKREEMGDGE